MRIRPLLLTASSLIVAAAVWYNVDWGFNALRLYMAASQPLEAGEPPHRETAGEVEFIATALTDQLDMPWSFAFMPGGDILVSERGGTLQRLDPDTGELAPVTGVPDVFYKGQVQGAGRPAGCRLAPRLPRNALDLPDLCGADGRRALDHAAGACATGG